MRASNPLLNSLSNINEIKSFCDSFSKNKSSSLILTSAVARGYFIGAMSLKNKLVVVSDDAFGLYHESLGISSLKVEYLPAAIEDDLFPKIFNKSTTKHLHSLGLSLSDNKPDVIFTEGGLGAHVPATMLENNSGVFSIRVNDRLKISDAINKLIEYGYDENIEAKYIGEYARRGGIIDVFPNNTKNPVRIELDGNVVSSIRFYNPTSQLSIDTTEHLLIPNLKHRLTNILSITYNDLFDNLGYTIIDENIINNTCRFDYVYQNNGHESKSLVINNIYLNIKNDIRKINNNYPRLYVVGGGAETKNMFPKNAVYIDGYINGNIQIEACGITVIGASRKKVKNVHMGKEDVEKFYSYKWGDFITHANYGVGIYRGLVKKQNMDYLKLEYANNTIVHLSAQRVDMIAPLIGTKKPMLNDIGSRNWSSRKIKTRKNIQNIISEMIKVNKNSQSQREVGYKKEDYLENELAESFPYIETEDQATAIMDIYKDMTSPGLMDRLIIGDVGYGKTEVALRAAAKAAFSGVFVMVVVPTTILADQHYILFKNRLENFGVTVEMLSRFTTTNKQKKIINNMQNKRVDILVGTHKLLGDNVPKGRLGLLIIDDEHRFGVIHKNKLLKMKNSVDVLTLTATPIPRTLQQSLLGLKSVSLINTPPEKRVPIKTQVIYQNWEFIKKVMEVEISRGGQVYFLHNRIESIPFYEKKIVEILPDVKIASAHGRMNSRELEKVILSFFAGDIQVLISTTIIEAGLDVPNANTIIITDSHMYGLSQLYQVRGRVGRGDRQGFCYLIIPKERTLSEEAIERLKTIQENTNLGSGYRIAIKDLELRGAGNVFGYEQSGHISNIGYHLYCKMFNEELNKSRGVVNNFRIPKIQYFGNASFSDSYMPLSQDRLFYYQRLSTAKDRQDMVAVQEEITDRFGKPGADTTNLYKITEIRIAYTNTLVKSIFIKKDRAVLTLTDADAKTPNKLSIGGLMNALERTEIKYMFKQANKDSFGLEFFCGASDEPLTMLIQNAELFYYDNNNT